MPRLPGRATAEGSARFEERARAKGAVDAGHFRAAAGNVRLASIGLGTYLGRADAATDHAVEEAVRVALASGRTNVVDTAINYRFQRAERSIGRALQRLVERGAVAREEVFLSTKNGYLAPDSESGLSAERYIDEELIQTRHLRPSEIVEGSHAMSVSFLADQFERSRTNLGVESIDLLYLHNGPDAQLPVVGREEFMVRLRAAFELFERFRRDGALGWYGLATWESLRAPRSAPNYLAVEEAVALARELAGADHGLRFLQCPFNVGLPEAAAVRNQPVRGERRTLFEAARALGLGCFTSVPLLQGQLARDGPQADGLTRAQSAIQFARSAPGTIGPLVGQKSPEHLSEDLSVAARAPWDEATFRRYL
jgi:aryl-alcohol dehydrogenase-like predicted oxidoreductase